MSFFPRTISWSYLQVKVAEGSPRDVVGGSVTACLCLCFWKRRCLKATLEQGMCSLIFHTFTINRLIASSPTRIWECKCKEYLRLRKVRTDGEQERRWKLLQNHDGLQCKSSSRFHSNMWAKFSFYSSQRFISCVKKKNSLWVWEQRCIFFTRWSKRQVGRREETSLSHLRVILIFLS